MDLETLNLNDLGLKYIKKVDKNAPEGVRTYAYAFISDSNMQLCISGTLNEYELHMHKGEIHGTSGDGLLFQVRRESGPNLSVWKLGDFHSFD